MTEQLYSPEGVAEILNVKPNTVRRWLQNKKLAGIRIGRLWRVKQSELDELLKGGTKIRSNTYVSKGS